jgi:hypothetical protein
MIAVGVVVSVVRGGVREGQGRGRTRWLLVSPVCSARGLRVPKRTEGGGRGAAEPCSIVRGVRTPLMPATVLCKSYERMRKAICNPGRTSYCVFCASPRAA